MKDVFIENGGSTQKVYETMLVEPESLSIFNSELAMEIVKELAKKPQCAMDMSRKLGENEQKIYYHLRKMIAANIVKLERSEARYGMTAKVYSLASPVIAAKLHESAYTKNTFTNHVDQQMQSFFSPFVKDGKLNALIIVGAPSPHGSYGATARDGIHIVDFGLFMGKVVSSLNGIDYKTDTEIDESSDLKNNLILFGNPKINTITDRINSHMPIFFDKGKEWAITSKLTGNSYDFDNDAVIVKFKNPFDKRKEILLMAGKRSQGLKSAVLAFTRHHEEVLKGNIEDERVIAKVVRGLDKDGDGIVDSVQFME